MSVIIDGRSFLTLSEAAEKAEVIVSFLRLRIKVGSNVLPDLETTLVEGETFVASDSLENYLAAREKLRARRLN